MATHQVRLWPDPVLTKTCAPVSFDDPTLVALINDLFDTMYAANGRGLAAPQIGVLKRIFVVDVTWKEGAKSPRLFINPEITSHGETVAIGTEQCLSIPDIPMNVSRPDEILLNWHDANGTPQSQSSDGNEARCIQHELDHLNGKVIFDHQSPETRTQLEANYAP